MATPEEKYYDSMNTLLAPVRWAKSLVQTVLLLVIAVVIGLAYPLILYCNGEPVTLASFMVTFLTLLALFTVFYAPYYLVFGGIAGLVTIGMLCEHGDATTNPTMAFLNEWNFMSLVSGFLVIGIVQRYIRHRIFDPPKEPKPQSLSFVDQLNQNIRHERRTREYDAMSPEQRETMTRLFGDNYLTWPESNAKSAPASDTATEDDNELSKLYATLGIGKDATFDEVKQAYRDLAKVWHPDRFDGGDTRLKQKAEAQLKAINDAYARIQERNPPPPMVSDIEETSLQKNDGNTDAIKMSLSKDVECATDAMTAVAARMMSSLLQMRSGRLNREEALSVVNQALVLQQDAVNRVQKLIARFERELPTFSISELESNLDTLKTMGLELAEAATSFKTRKVSGATVMNGKLLP
jgi:hypothetical protein